MAKKRNQSACNIEDLTDAEISAAIHYLDLDSSDENGAGSDSATREICLTLMIYFWSAQSSSCFTPTSLEGKPFLAWSD
jgi:hypothetical protein